jgi:hypothetical protein
MDERQTNHDPVGTFFQTRSSAIEAPREDLPGVRQAARQRKQTNMRINWIILAGILFLSAILPLNSPWLARAITAVNGSLFGTGEAPRPSFSPVPGAVGTALQQDTQYGVTVDVPDGWNFVSDPQPVVTDPRMLFGAATYAIGANDSCIWLDELPRDGVAMWLVEWTHIADLGGSGKDFPTRPQEFSPTDGQPREQDCGVSSPPVMVFRFGQSGRYFEARVALGEQAPTESADAAIQLISSLTVEPIAGR